MNNVQMEKQTAAPQEAESTRDRPVFMPRADIYETADAIVVMAELPGVDEKNADIVLENGILTIHAKVEPWMPQGYQLAYREYEVGDFHRAFTLSDEVDQSGIQAVMKNGILKLTLPKSREARTRKIAVRAE